MLPLELLLLPCLETESWATAVPVLLGHTGCDFVVLLHELPKPKSIASVWCCLICLFLVPRVSPYKMGHRICSYPGKSPNIEGYKIYKDNKSVINAWMKTNYFWVEWVSSIGRRTISNILFIHPWQSTLKPTYFPFITTQIAKVLNNILRYEYSV